MAFAVASGNFSSASIWDTGVVPTGSEDAYANSFTVSISDTRSIGSVRNTATDYYLPNTVIPLMTSATSPSGIVTQTTQNLGTEGWKAFDRNTATLWQTTAGVTSGIITYKFPDDSPKVIKKYFWRGSATATTTPRNFRLEASNVFDFSISASLDSQTFINVGANGTFTSGILANTGSFTYYRLNVTATNGGTLQIVEIEMTESTSTAVGGLPGGFYNLLNSSSLTCTAAQGVVIGSTTQPVQFSGVSGSAATLRASVTSVPLVAGYSAIQNNGIGTLNILGDLSFAAASGINNRNIINHVNGITNIVGTLTMTFLGTSINNNALQASNGTVIITGQVTGGGQGGSNQIILGGSAAITINGDYITNASQNIAGGSSITVNGNVTNTGTGVAISSPGVPVTVTGALTVNGSGGGTSSTTGNTSIGGSITCTSSGNGVTTTTGLVNVSGSVTISGAGIGVSNTTGIVTIGGNITASTTNNAVSSQTLVKCSGLLFNRDNIQAVYAPRITIDPTTTSITFQKITGGNQIMYIGSSTAYNLPAINNVRSGSVYGQSNELTGTMIVQTPENVLLGTLVDNTVGTLIMTPANLITELNTSGTPVAVRLRNCATVETTGDQMASYSI